MESPRILYGDCIFLNILLKKMIAECQVVIQVTDRKALIG